MKIHITLAMFSLTFIAHLSAAESEQEKTGAAAQARERERKAAEIERQIEEKGRVANERIDALAKYLGTLLKGRAIPLEKQDAMMAHLTEDRMRRTLLNMDEKAAKAYLEGAVELAEAAHIAQRAELEEKHEAERKEEVASAAPATGPAKSSAAGGEKGLPFVTEPKPGTTQSRQAATEFEKHVGKGPLLRQLPAVAMHKIAEFVGPEEKKLVLTHVNVDMRLNSKTNDDDITHAMAQSNHQLTTFMGAMITSPNLINAWPPEIANLLAGYEYATMRAPTILQDPILRARGQSFCCCTSNYLVSGVKKDSESLDAAIKRSEYKFDGPEMPYALGPSVIGKPGNLLLRDSVSATKRVIICTSTGGILASIPDNAAIALLPLGFGTRTNEIVAWNMRTSTFGYYAIDSKQFIAAHHISDGENKNLIGVPAYSLKPYSTLCVIHDNYSKLTIFDPRFKPQPWLTLKLRQVKQKGIPSGIGLKWDGRDAPINVLVASRIAAHIYVADIYKLETLGGFKETLTEPSSREEIGWLDYLFGAPASAEALPGGGREGAVEAPY